MYQTSKSSIIRRLYGSRPAALPFSLLFLLPLSGLITHSTGGKEVISIIVHSCTFYPNKEDGDQLFCVSTKGR